MTVWIIAVLMSTVATAGLLLPLVWRRNRGDNSAAYDIEVYKDQLNQVGQDYDRRLLSAEQAQAAKTEISRRLLQADTRLQVSLNRSAKTKPTRQIAVIALVALIVPLGALSFYSYQGAPGIAGMPFAERTSEQPQTARSRPPMNLEAAATQLRERLTKNPNDLRGWLLLARTYVSIQQFPQAVSAFEKALSLENGNANIISSYGEALYLAAGEVVTPASRTAFEETLKIRPDDTRSRYYLALSEYQAGDKKKALHSWAALVGDSPADAPWLSSVRTRAAEAAKELGLDVATVIPQPLPPSGDVEESQQPARGPMPASIEEAANLSSEERDERIRGMVDGLAAKLENNPRDFQGWMQLIRSYAVLKETNKAKKALAKAREVFARAPFPKQQLAALASQLGLQGEAPRGPTEEDVKAAQEMSPEDRQTMIESMVAQLAERLEENPDDLAGWARLARSYAVLGKLDKAKEALSSGLRAAPNNVDLLVLFGRTVRKMNGNRSTSESLDAMRKVLALAPTQVEALWFLGDAAAEVGNKEKAKSLWERAILQFPAGAPERAQLRTRIDQLK